MAWEHKVAGVSAANISKVAGVAKASIEKVAGVGHLFTPADITTVLWLDAADESTIQGSGDPFLVDGIDDKSGNGYDFNEASPHKPYSGERTINGINCISPNASGAWGMGRDAADNLPLLGLDVTWFFVVDPDGESSQSKFFQSSPYYTGPQNEINGMPHVSAYWRHECRDSGDTAHTAVSDIQSGDAPVMGDIERNSGDDLVYFNKNGGASSDSQAFNATDLRTASGQTAQLLSYYGSNLSDSLFGELIIVNSILSAVNKAKMQGYLAHKWGLEANLPSDHPYKNHAPWA